jgi:hypothetical protein
VQLTVPPREPDYRIGWTASVILEALTPGTIQGHVSTATYPRELGQGAATMASAFGEEGEEQEDWQLPQSQVAEDANAPNRMICVRPPTKPGTVISRTKSAGRTWVVLPAVRIPEMETPSATLRNQPSSGTKHTVPLWSGCDRGFSAFVAARNW